MRSNRTKRYFRSIATLIFMLTFCGCSKNTIVSPNGQSGPSSPPTDVKVNLSIRPEGAVYSLSWKDNSRNETAFKITARSREAATYEEIGQTPRNTTEFVDNKTPVDKTYYYRVHAISKRGDSVSRWEGLRLGYFSSIDKPNIVDYELYGAVLLVLWSEGLSSFDVSNASSPKLMNTIPLKGYVKTGYIGINSALAYIVDDDQLFIMSIKNPIDPVFISNLDLNSSLTDMQCAGSTIYGLTENNELMVIDASNPKRARKARVVKIEGEPKNLGLSSDYLLVADANKGISVYNIKNPTGPGFITSFQPRPARYYNAISVQENKIVASVRDFENQIHIIDFSNPLKMTTLSKISLNWIPLETAATQDVIFVPESEGGVEIFLGKDPLRMKLVGTIDPEINKIKTWPTLTAMSYFNKLYLFSIP